MAKNKTYIKRREKGLCTDCGKVKCTNGRSTCEPCLEKRRIYNRETRAFYRSIGICPICKKNKLFSDEKTCPECLAHYAEVNKKSRERLGKTDMDYYREHNRKLAEQGLCRASCGRKRAEGHTYCEECLAKLRENSRKKKAIKRLEYTGIARSERPGYGLCYTCGKPLDRDGRVCQKCADIMTRNLPKVKTTEHWKRCNEIIFKK